MNYDRERLDAALFDGRAEYMKRRIDAKCPSHCRSNHPVIGYFPNDWHEHELCPVCVLFNMLAAARAAGAAEAFERAAKACDSEGVYLAWRSGGAVRHGTDIVSAREMQLECADAIRALAEREAK